MLYTAEKSTHAYFIFETFDRQKTCRYTLNWKTSEIV